MSVERNSVGWVMFLLTNCKHLIKNAIEKAKPGGLFEDIQPFGIFIKLNSKLKRVR